MKIAATKSVIIGAIAMTLLMSSGISAAFAGGPRLDYYSDSTRDGAKCWVNGYDSGFAGKYDKNRADECSNEKYDEYNAAWPNACRDGGFTEDECNGFKENPVEIEDYEALKGENDRTCNDAGYKDGEAGAFNKDRDKGCYEFGSYKNQFQSGCETHTTQASCELLYEDKEYYCPNHPDIAGCVDFLHNATNKKASPYDSCAGMGDPSPNLTCFQETNPGKYCLEYDDPYCKFIGSDFRYPADRYINQPGKGPGYHTEAFLIGYMNGFSVCNDKGYQSTAGFPELEEGQRWGTCEDKGDDIGLVCDIIEENKK